ncbi:MAG: multifunctional fatty acid oxidation complex subunit alpha [Bdellovibrionales bacterium GWB1_55_8]|nr:MAG: multifunctional fatty acid oxidation complex subunit alpha [Bdellovibrionales bacterium GWB1_55_8]
MQHYDGQAVKCSMLENGIAELKFDLKDDSVNKFNAVTLKELREAVDWLKQEKSLKGVLLTSGKDVFIVGADVTEFLEHFKKSEQELTEWLLQVDKTFSDIEDLNVPSVAAINGFAFGGGFECALAASYRVMSAAAKVGVPEVKLGIFPGWGGTVRLSRLAGADNAIEWIAGGEQYSADAALKVGAVDAVVAPDKVREAALDLLTRAMNGNADWKARHIEKTSPLKLNQVEATMVFEGAKGFVGGKAGPNYPAPVAAIEVMQKGAGKSRDEALQIEAKTFARIAKTPTAHALVSVFLADQYVKKTSKKLSKAAAPVQTAAVLGAGIMGGGVAYQSSVKNIPILMKDIAPKALELGLKEAVKLLDKQVSRGKITSAQMGETIGKITPTLSYGDFKAVDLVVEAVVENEKVKKAVLADVEANSKDDAIITSNTSTISITKLAEGLKRPENFCGMHFFNPVHRMPLVEVIRGKKSSEKAVATTVAYAAAMGKTPIVVNDCAGFLVNRVLFPYFAGFVGLVRDGVDFQRIDKVMEKFGWPMGPAYLLDVVGIDTANHADAVMADAFPDRMKNAGKTAIQVMYENKRFGQKNGIGFYKYVPDRKGFPKKEADPQAYEILKAVIEGNRNADVTDQEIIDRMMLPMLFECSRCLEENIVASPAETDLALIYGLGFPPFRGGAFRYADSVGAKQLVAAAEKYQKLGRLYEPTAQFRALAEAGKTFY